MERVKAFKRKMLLWTSNWSQEDQQSREEVPFTPDAVEIASLLQAIGFRIRFMDRSLPKEMCPVSGVPADCPACRVILMCPRSGVRIELEAPTSSCRCPSPDESGLGQTWTFEEPANEQMAKAVDSLVPKLSGEISQTVSELIGGLFNVMSLFPDQNHNDIKEPFDSRVYSTTVTSTYNRSSPMKTPATGIAVVTPNAPCVPKAAQGDSKFGVPGRYRSLDTLISTGGFPDDLPEPGQLTPKDDGRSGSEAHMEVDGELDATITQGPGSATKKFISKSSPAVSCTEKFQKSSNFDFEDTEMEDGHMTEKEKNSRKLLRSNTYVAEDGEPRAGPPPRSTPSPLMIHSSSQNSILLSKLQDIQQSVSDIIFIVGGNETNLSNIGDVSKKSQAVAGAVQRRITDNVRPIRCLSDFGSVPNLTRAATTVRSIPRLNMRRYATTIAAPATPTTSRRPGNTSVDRTKKGSTTSKISSNRLAPNPGNSGQKISVSPSSPTASKNKQTGFPVSPNRRANNSDKKYVQSHVQSNIPKPGIARK